MSNTNTDTRAASAVSQATQPSAEPTEAEIRAGAEAAYEVARIREHFPTDFDRAPRGIQNTYLGMARAALVAARKVAGR